MVQATFTKQKRELAKAAAWIQKLRAQEHRVQTLDPEGNLIHEERKTYVEHPPEVIAGRVLEIVTNVVHQHGCRQQANGHNTGRFTWYGVEADLTVPQLRALQDAYSVLSDLVTHLPKANPHQVPNATVDGRPAFKHRPTKHYETHERSKPYEEESTTRVRTYTEEYKTHTHSTQRVDVDFGLPASQLEDLRELLVDLGTAIQVAIDEANTKGYRTDPVLDGVIQGVRDVLLQHVKPTPS